MRASSAPGLPSSFPTMPPRSQSAGKGQSSWAPRAAELQAAKPGLALSPGKWSQTAGAEPGRKSERGQGPSGERGVGGQPRRVT